MEPSRALLAEFKSMAGIIESWFLFTLLAKQGQCNEIFRLRLYFHQAAFFVPTDMPGKI
jgi:hypothetical protein